MELFKRKYAGSITIRHRLFTVHFPGKYLRVIFSPTGSVKPMKTYCHGNALQKASWLRVLRISLDWFSQFLHYLFCESSDQGCRRSLDFLRACPWLTKLQSATWPYNSAKTATWQTNAENYSPRLARASDCIQLICWRIMTRISVLTPIGFSFEIGKAVARGHNRKRLRPTKTTPWEHQEQ